MSAHKKLPVADEKKPTKPKSPTIPKMIIVGGMKVSDILAVLPDSVPVLAQYGLSCFSCAANAYETLEDGCKTHGMEESDIDDLVKDLNVMMQSKPGRPQTLTITEPAATALKQMMEDEGKVGWGLLVGLDDEGGFCMEFRAEAAADEKVCSNDAVSDVMLFASNTTLAAIGGATIDLREGRFKLDLLEDTVKKRCGCGGNCVCNHSARG